MRLLKKEQGFSLVELMIALTILAIGMLGILGMQVYAIRGNAYSSNMSVASNIAQQKLEFFRNLSYGAIKGPPVLYFGTNTVGWGYSTQALLPPTTLPPSDYINATNNDKLSIDVEAYGALRADYSGTVFQDYKNNETGVGTPDGIPDKPFDRFRRVTITKVTDDAIGSNITIVFKVLVYWRSPTPGVEHRVVMMSSRSLGE